MIIDDKRIEEALSYKSKKDELNEVLAKTKKLERLSMQEVSVLLNTTDKDDIKRILEAANWVKNEIYGKRLVIFAPLYTSNICKNECLYCAFKTSNKNLKRTRLNQEQILRETEQLLKQGQKRVLLVAGENGDELDYTIEAIKTIYSARDGKNSIRRINVNIAALEVEDFKKLKEAQIGTYQLFQETYHRGQYAKYHISGPKADYDYHLSAIDRAFDAGIDDVGIGVLFGLTDYKYEILALMSHIEHLEAKYGMGPHTISVPRLEPATGSDIASNPPHPVSDDDFRKIIAILRVAVPYVGIILSTRENAETRRDALNLGISQISAGSKTNPGGYSEEKGLEQFSLGDHRLLDDVLYDICSNGFMPSFCTGCYRLGRTGLDFMEYAKPGDIKQKCLPNALVTFEEYLLDYASEKTVAVGRKLIDEELAKMKPEIREKTAKMIDKIRSGERDLYI